jgi:hypothetical protein
MRRRHLIDGLLLVAAAAAPSCGTATTRSGRTALVSAAVQIVVEGCANVDIHGTGLAVAPARIATVAHVVAGATAITVRNEHGQAGASVVYFDAVNDVAVLAVDPSLVRHLLHRCHWARHPQARPAQSLCSETTSRSFSMSICGDWSTSARLTSMATASTSGPDTSWPSTSKVETPARPSSSMAEPLLGCGRGAGRPNTGHGRCAANFSLTISPQATQSITAIVPEKAHSPPDQSYCSDILFAAGRICNVGRRS